MRCPADHEKYYTQAEAENELRWLVVQAKRTGNGGKSWKRLNVFRCGNHWHIGRANKLPANYHKPAPAPKPPSTGELRRKLDRMAREWERHDDYLRRQRAAELGAVIAEDLAVIHSENELREIQRQVRQMFWPE